MEGMPKLLEPHNLNVKRELTRSEDNHNKYKHIRHIFKSKEKVFSLRCSQTLKRKLKKYRLRKDGEEDKDVLDVSQTFQVALQIKSPTKTENIICEFEERPTNYLFKMGRKKQTLKEKNGCEVNSETNKKGAILKEDKKPANAFKLLMDGRNKSIGSNSPGKDKTDDCPESLEIIEKRGVKAKRLLVLQKMAEAKGSLKKKEIEDYQEECIQKKMDKRADRLKAMILKAKSSQSEFKITTDTKQKSPPRNKSDKTKSLNIIDMFIENADINESPNQKPILKEDEEFLSKLSPSMRKKENMLCYFKKIEKDPNSLEDDSLESDSLIIKVKLKPRNKTKKKLSLKRNHEDFQQDKPISNVAVTNDKDVKEKLNKKKDVIDNGVVSEVQIVEHIHIIDTTTAEVVKDETIKELNICDKQETRKRKYNKSKKSVDVVEVEETTRPKRSARKPIKYNSDVYFTSSDEELQVSTPKKKKNSDKEKKSQKNTEIMKGAEVENCKNVKQMSKLEKKNVTNPKQPSKLAPIFSSKSSQQTSEANEAKQRFLQSGVPEKLKKIMVEHKSNENPSNEFLAVVHVQQINSCSEESNTGHKTFEYPWAECKDCEDIKLQNQNIKTFLNLNTIAKNQPPPMFDNVQSVLQKMKLSYPKFPVYRTYQTLKNKSKGDFKDCNVTELDNSVEIINNLPDMKNESPDKLMWSDKYRPLSSKQIIGNFETVRELKSWLETWTAYDDKKINCKNNSDSSDFCMSDTDSKDSTIRSSKNLLIITGPVGSGKTLAVYAVAAELAIKVIEVNASSRRTGKIMLQDLQEATQSHKVNRGKGSSQENSQKSQDVIECISGKPKRRGRKKKNAVVVVQKEKNKKLLSQDFGTSQESTSTCMSLILIDDADVVFEQDDGFCSAIAQLVYSSKRPVILITGSLTCIHLQRFVQMGRILKTNPFIPRMLGTWLDIMCLADEGRCRPGLGMKILDFFKGDIRKTINYLQFFVSTGTSSENSDSQNSDSYKPQLEDENSNMSWIDVENHDNKVQNEQKIKLFGDETGVSPKLFDIWWNIPKILNYETDVPIAKDLDSIANAIDSFSAIDYFSNTKISTQGNIASTPWYSAETDSVVEIENLTSYDMLNYVSDEISHYVAKSSVLEIKGKLVRECLIEFDSPLMAEQRQKDRLIARHSSLTSILNPSTTLDRKSLALDYWSACRSICRIEKSKTDNNMRRNNRFCHYLKTLNVLCKSESFDNLCESLKSFDHS